MDAQRSALSLVKKNRWLVEKRRDLRFDLADVELVESAAIRRCGISHPIEASNLPSPSGTGPSDTLTTVIAPPRVV